MARSRRANENNETGAGDLRRGFEIHQAEALAKVKMLLGFKIELRRRAMLQHDDIVVFIGALGHILERQVGDGRQGRFQFAGEAALFLLALLDLRLELCDLGNARGGAGLVTRGLGLTNLARGFVARLLGRLERGDMGAPGFVEGQDGRRMGGKAAPRQCGVKAIRIVADEFQVEHARLPGLWMESQPENGHLERGVPY